MDFASLPRTVQYAVVFVGAGTIAVGIKATSELGQTRVAGLVAMVPMKIIIAWLIVGAAAGSRGIADSTNGMLMGLGAILVSFLAVKFGAAYLSPGPLICLGLAAWFATALGAEAVARWMAR